jgi:hypothetical protein
MLDDRTIKDGYRSLHSRYWTGPLPRAKVEEDDLIGSPTGRQVAGKNNDRGGRNPCMTE